MYIEIVSKIIDLTGCKNIIIAFLAEVSLVKLSTSIYVHSPTVTESINICYWCAYCNSSKLENIVILISQVIAKFVVISYILFDDI